MMRFLFPLLSILLNIGVFAEITNKNILGEWIAYSENHMAIGGDFNVKPTSIEYKKHGEVNFKILKASESEYILELDKDVDDGIFMRIGLPTNSLKCSLEALMEPLCI